MLEPSPAAEPSTAPARPSDRRPVSASLPAWARAGRARGWQAELELAFEARAGKTRLTRKRHRGPLRVQRAFYPEGATVSHVYLLHPPAGIVGGDDLRIRLTVAERAHALLTSPGATRFYYARDEAACLQQVARVCAGSTLEWLPMETLFMRGARARVMTKVELEKDAVFIGWDIQGFGRPALGEDFGRGSLDVRLDLHRDGHPLLLDCFRVEAGRIPGLGDAAASATFLATGADARALERARSCLSNSDTVRVGASLIDDVLVVRGIAHRCEPLLEQWKAVWHRIRPLTVGRDASPPRIWHT
ncbi:MAG: urease accessory protein UreD [Myxococcota bacterium]|nr:urease accessory protein UreD [Myxococcota bacterium]